MIDRTQNNKHTKKYSKISTEKRIKLVGLVLDQGFTITKAAKMLHVKRPTAKLIIKRFQRAGTFFNKKMPKIRNKAKNEVSQNKQPQEIAEPQKETPPQMKLDENEATNTSCTSPFPVQPQVNYILYYLPYIDYQYIM